MTTEESHGATATMSDGVPAASQSLEETAKELGISFGDLEEKYHVELNVSLDTVVIIDNLPKVDKAKEAKLVAVLNKALFAAVKASPLPESICMPRSDDEAGLTKGYMFVEFGTIAETDAVLKATHGFRLDKQHVLTAVRLSEFDRIMAVDTEAPFVSPQIAPFEECEHLQEWLMDPMARDQFVTLAGTTGTVSWNSKSVAIAADVVHTRANWADSYVQWSPNGTYLATVHVLGIMLWGGSTFGRMGKFPHHGVKLLSFSPRETYLTTWSPFVPDVTSAEEPNVIVWHVATGTIVRAFSIDNGSDMNAIVWPFIKFSHDDKFAARISEEAPPGGAVVTATTKSLILYEMPAFKGGKAIPVESLKDFSWSPVDYSLVHWTVGTEDTPSRITLINGATRAILSTKNLFNVNACSVYWQSAGDYLAVLLERHSKNRKIIFSNVEIFRLRDKNIPVEGLEFKTVLQAFSWEPASDRFLVASTEEFKTTTSFYTMKGKDVRAGTSIVQKIGQVETKTTSRFLWSPKGDFLLISGTDSNSAVLHFVNCIDYTIMATREHFLGTDVAWDPSGRYVASWVSAWRQASDHGYMIFDLRGEQLARVNISRMSLFGWRPRPLSMLTAEVQRTVRKNIKNYASAFEEADLHDLLRASADSSESKGNAVLIWNEWRRHCRREYEARTSARRGLIGREHFFDFDAPRSAAAAASGEEGESQFLQEWIEESVEETEEVISGGSGVAPPLASPSPNDSD